MENRSRLVAVRAPRRPDGAVLVLHGGGSREEGVPVSPTQPSVLRMVPVALRIAAAGRGRLAVYRVLNSARGWGGTHTPVDDVVWALEQLRARWGHSLDTALVGHSLGGRAALMAVDQPAVRSAVALNPWLLPDDLVDATGRRVLVVHGDQDRVASPDRAAEVVRRLARTADAGYVSVSGGQHAMLRRAWTFERLASQFVRTTLLGAAAPEEIAQAMSGSRVVV